MATGLADWWSRVQAILSMKFTDLSDTPGSYTAQVGKGIKVNLSETAIEWTDCKPDEHASRHKNLGADSIKLDEFAPPDDNINLNVSTSAHGLCPKIPGDENKVFKGDGTYGYPVCRAKVVWVGPLDFTSTSWADIPGCSLTLDVKYGAYILHSINVFCYSDSSTPASFYGVRLVYETTTEITIEHGFKNTSGLNSLDSINYTSYQNTGPYPYPTGPKTWKLQMYVNTGKVRVTLAGISITEFVMAPGHLE